MTGADYLAEISDLLQRQEPFSSPILRIEGRLSPLASCRCAGASSGLMREVPGFELGVGRTPAAGSGRLAEFPARGQPAGVLGWGTW